MTLYAIMFVYTDDCDWHDNLDRRLFRTRTAALREANVLRKEAASRGEDIDTRVIALELEAR